MIVRARPQSNGGLRQILDDETLDREFTDTIKLNFKIKATFAVATAATMRSYSPSIERSNGSAVWISFKEITADVNKLPTDDFNDQSPVYSKKR
jgi:hypothetical protein